MFVYLTVCISACLSISLLVFLLVCISPCLSICLLLGLSTVCLSVNLSMSPYLSIRCLPARLSVNCQSFCKYVLYVCPSVTCPPVFLVCQLFACLIVCLSDIRPSLFCSWSDCSRSCGGGIRRSERVCDRPAPKNGGLHCIGDRKRYESCETFDCELGASDYRLEQCQLVRTTSVC